MKKYRIEEPTHVDLGEGSSRIVMDFEPGEHSGTGDKAIALEHLAAQGIAKPVPAKPSKAKE